MTGETVDDVIREAVHAGLTMQFVCEAGDDEGTVRFTGKRRLVDLFMDRLEAAEARRVQS